MTDLFDDFLRVGRALSRSLRLRPGAIEEASAIVRCAVGDDWIKESVQRYRRLAPSLKTAHQLHRLAECFSATSESQVVEIVELAAYLHGLARIESINSVAAQLRSDYDHAFLQLSFAFRLQQVGIRIERFEPQTLSGRAGDVLCADGEFRSVIECYCPRDVEVDREWELQRLQPELERFNARPVRIDVRAARRVTLCDCKRIQYFLRSLDVASGGPWHLTDEAATVDVSVIPPEELALLPTLELPQISGDASWAAQVSLADEADVRNMGAVPKFSRRALSYLRVWMSPEARAEASADPHVTLGKRLSRKLAQIRTEDNLARLVVAQIDGVEHLDDRVKCLSGNIQAELRRRHEKWNGAFLVNRRWMHTQRYMLHGIYIVGSERPIMEEAKFQALIHWERTSDVLSTLGS